MENEIESVRREHGASMGTYVDPVSNYHGPIDHVSLEESVRREHGAPMGTYVDPVSSYHGPIDHVSLEESVRREHGAPMGTPVDSMQVWGTNDEELKDIVNNLIHANAINNVGELLKQLPDEAIIKILETRYRNVANKLDDKYGLYKDVVEELGKRIDLDLNIILELLNQNRNLYNKNLNLSNLMGYDDYQNIIGLIESYKQKLGEIEIEIPLIDGFSNLPRINPQTNEVYNTFELIDQIEQYAIQKANELGADIGGKSI